MAREHGLNANLAFTWRHRYRAKQRASEATLLPVTVVSDMKPVIAAPPIKPESPSIIRHFLIPLLPSSMPWCSSSRHRSKNNKPRSRKW
ncbi:MAG: hypothetical protein VB142_04225, partial [Burkholderia sp.]